MAESREKISVALTEQQLVDKLALTLVDAKVSCWGIYSARRKAPHSVGSMEILVDQT